MSLDENDAAQDSASGRAGEHNVSEAVEIRPSDLRTVRRMLEGSLPKATRVWVFGSRAGEVAEAFDGSNLPYDVDIVDLWSVSERFAALIESHRMPLPDPDAALQGSISSADISDRPSATAGRR